MIKKEEVMGREVTLELGFTQVLYNFFGTQPLETKTIPFLGEEYRSYRKKVVSEGRLTRWGGLTSGTEKERAGIKRIKERRGRSAW